MSGLNPGDGCGGLGCCEGDAPLTAQDRAIIADHLDHAGDIGHDPAARMWRALRAAEGEIKAWRSTFRAYDAAISGPVVARFGDAFALYEALSALLPPLDATEPAVPLARAQARAEADRLKAISEAARDDYMAAETRARALESADDEPAPLIVRGPWGSKDGPL